MVDANALYEKWRSDRDLPAHDESLATDRARLEGFIAGIVLGVNEALLQLRETAIRKAVNKRGTTCIVSGRN